MTTPTPVPILRYSFDTWTSGNTVTNEGSLGSNYNGTLTSFTTAGSSATVISSSYATGTQCLSLVGSTHANSYLSIPPLTIGGVSWAICMWVKIASIPTGNMMLFVFGSNYEGVRHMNLNVMSSTGYVTYDQIDIETNQNNSISSNLSVCDNIWHHIAVVYNATVNTILMYIDGVINVSSSPFPQTPSELRVTNGI